MGVTYTSAIERDRLRGISVAMGRGRLALLAVGLLSMAAIALCLGGRWQAFALLEARRASEQPLNLNSRVTAPELEPVLSRVLEIPADARFAAGVLANALSAPGAESLTHVGAIGRIELPAGSIERTRGLLTFADRLRDGRERALLAGQTAPASLPLFTAAQIAALKPAFVVRDAATHRRIVIGCTVALLLAFQVVPFVWRLRRLDGDLVLLAAVHLLTTFGLMVMLSRQDPLRDTLLVTRYTAGVLTGLAVCVALSLVNVRRSVLLQLGYVSLAGALVLSLLLIAFGSGPGTSGAKVNLGPMQPIEVIRPLIACFLAAYLGRRWELLRQLRETSVRGQQIPAWLDLPRLEYLLPVAAGVGLSLLLFFALRDLGPALLMSVLVLTLVAVARARAGIVIAGIAVLAAGFAAGYWLDISSTLATRVAMWRSPWANAVRGGDQVAQALWSLAAGAMSGTGLGLGETRYLPAGHTDLALAAMAEESGVAGVIAVALAWVTVTWRGLRIARSAPTDTMFFLAVALTLSLVTPVLVMAAGLLGLLPLTGVVTPFVSYGGSAMVANFASLGLLIAIRAGGGAATDTWPFEIPLRWVARTLAGVAAVILVAWARVQVVSADRVLVEPQLSLQADGGLRYQYNPRVLDVARELPRGAVLDRDGVPIAGEQPAVNAAGAEWATRHVSLDDRCPNDARRCYPLGGQAFHLLGDANTRLNWSASNTSYVERDAEDNLRGFDDRSVVVRAADPEGASITTTIRRDYTDLVPLVRHRWEPHHPSVVALFARPRDVHVTVDARLQMDVSAIVARSVAAAKVQHAAAVVLDASTGEILASVSYPWPSSDPGQAVETADTLLDRARYGLYPPGSTFKLITAAAALSRDPHANDRSFTCARLPGGRVGAKIPGWTRPIRDDVLDRHAHGTLTMHDGLVKSCNAYFAQLAVELGAEQLSKTAALAGISYPLSGSPARVRENLPYSGYGQGEVLATPLRLARLAAAIGSGGTIREPSIVRDGLPVTERRLLPPSAAQLLAGYMRDVVTEGTGRRLGGHPIPIAGKTGTAEVDGAPSHAWFVGFAPAGPARRRIAFAVLLENAGYGGAAAAAAAGDVVSAAARLGLVK